MKARRILTGLALGVASGLLFDGLLLINSSGWLLNPILMAPLPLLGLIVGIVLGWRGIMPSLPGYAVLLIAVVFWPVLFWGPVMVKEWRFRAFASELPAYLHADRRIQSITVLGGDDPPSIRVRFETKDGTIQEMVKFYADYLLRNNWVPEQQQVEYRRDVWYNFRKDDGNISIIGYAARTETHNVAIIRRYSTWCY